jgi:hypothetical protein
MPPQSKSRFRLRYLLGRYGKVFVVSLMLMSAVAFASAALAHTATPETRQVTEQTDVQSFETTVSTSATVTGNTSLYESGRTLSNMPVYLVGASPNVTVTAHTEVPEDRAVNVSQQITIDLYATRNGEMFWSNTTTLAADSERVTDGSLVTETTINIREIQRGRLSEVQPEAESVGVLHAKIHADTVYKANTYEGSLAVTTPVEMTSRSYAIDAPLSDERSHATPVTRTVTDSGEQVTTGTPVTSNATAQAGFLPGFGSGTLSMDTVIRVVLGVIAIVAAFTIRRIYHRLPSQEELRQAYDRVRYGDWISQGQIPESDAYERIAIEEFVDLIDIAIDSDKRVIHDREQGIYAVIDGTAIYHHSEADDKGRDGEYPSDLQPGRVDEDVDTAESASASETRVTDGGTGPEKTDPPSDPSSVADDDSNCSLDLTGAYAIRAVLGVVGLAILLIAVYTGRQKFR